MNYLPILHSFLVAMCQSFLAPTSRFSTVVVAVMLSTSLYSQRSYEYAQAQVQCDTCHTQTYTIEKEYGQHHCVLLIQQQGGWDLKTWVIQKNNILYDAFVLDSLTQEVYSGDTPYFELFFGKSDGYWNYTQIWSATYQLDAPWESRVYLNWIICRHKGVVTKYLEGCVTENIGASDGVRWIKEFFTPR